MPALPTLAISWRLRLARMTARIKYPKLTLLIIVVVAILVGIWAPPAYRESWLDPFSTLNMPNRLLHPNAIDRLGLVDPNDPYHPHFFANQAVVHEFMKSLGQAQTLSTQHSPQELAGQPVMFFTLHGAASKYHPAFDYALQFYPQEQSVRFGEQEFKISDRSVLLIQQIKQNMETGWWK